MYEKMQLPDNPLSNNGLIYNNRVEFARSIESILEILIVMDHEVVENWVRMKFPNGVGLFESSSIQSAQVEPRKGQRLIRQSSKQVKFKINFNCAICANSKSINWCETHERFECEVCHANEVNHR